MSAHPADPAALLKEAYLRLHDRGTDVRAEEAHDACALATEALAILCTYEQAEEDVALAAVLARLDRPVLDLLTRTAIGYLAGGKAIGADQQAIRDFLSPLLP